MVQKLNSLVRLWKRGRSVTFAFWSQVLWVKCRVTMVQSLARNPSNHATSFLPSQEKTDRFNQGLCYPLCVKGYRKSFQINSHCIVVILFPTKTQVSCPVRWYSLLSRHFPLSSVFLVSPLTTITVSDTIFFVLSCACVPSSPSWSFWWALSPPFTCVLPSGSGSKLKVKKL